MAVEYAFDAPLLDVPHDGRRVATSGDEPLAVRSECNRGHFFGMPFEDADFLSLHWIAKADRSIAAAGGNKSAAGRPRHGRNRRGMPFEKFAALLAGDLPPSQHSIGPASCEQLAVGRKGER